MTPFLILSDKWAIGADRLQWIVYRRRAHTRRGGQWEPVSFVACTKTVLLRCLREKGAVVTPSGEAALDALPDTFTEWRQGSADSAVAA